MTKRLPTVVLALVVPVAAAVVVIVTLSVTSATAGPTSTGGKPTITIKDFSFGPDPLKVAPGTAVTVFNRDDATHTVTSDRAGAFDTGDIDGRGRATIRVSAPGTYRYFCQIHDYMHGVIHVSK
jgi:plastocyanin